jgi:GT2 family glycosyltransferase
MKASIIIPSLNSPIISDVIDCLEGQEEASAIGEILVVGKDRAGLIGTREKVRFIDTREKVCASKARNLGVEQARNDLILFLDSDCLPCSRWLSEHLIAQRAGQAVVGGGVAPLGDNYWSLAYNLSLFHEFLATLPGGERDYLPTLNMSVQLKVIQEVGQFDEDLERGQDIEWSSRVRRKGYSLHFCPRAIVRHLHSRDSFLAMWRDCARSGYFMRQVRLSNPDMLSAPLWLRSRLAILLLSPFIAAVVTGRILWRNPSLIRLAWAEIPAVYMTKLAWCWGAVGPRP